MRRWKRPLPACRQCASTTRQKIRQTEQYQLLSKSYNKAVNLTIQCVRLTVKIPQDVKQEMIRVSKAPASISAEADY